MERTVLQEGEGDPGVAGAAAIIIREGGIEPRPDDQQIRVQVIRDHVDGYRLAGLALQGPGLHERVARRSDVRSG